MSSEYTEQYMGAMMRMTSDQFRQVPIAHRAAIPVAEEPLPYTPKPPTVAQVAHQRQVHELMHNPEYIRLSQSIGSRQAAIRLIARDVARLINMDKRKYPFLGGILAGGLAKSNNNIQRIAEHLILIID